MHETGPANRTRDVDDERRRRRRSAPDRRRRDDRRDPQRSTARRPARRRMPPGDDEDDEREHRHGQKPSRRHTKRKRGHHETVPAELSRVGNARVTKAQQSRRQVAARPHVGQPSRFGVWVTWMRRPVARSSVNTSAKLPVAPAFVAKTSERPSGEYEPVRT